MRLGFIKPTYPGEKRVALLPEHITADFENELLLRTALEATWPSATKNMWPKAAR